MHHNHRYPRGPETWDSLGMIPKTFQDSITIALKLNIRYLWIDSLRIVQDDAQDWEIEFSKMSYIYQDATLMLATTKSSSDSYGCFKDEDGISNTEIQLPEGFSDCSIAVQKPLRH